MWKSRVYLFQQGRKDWHQGGCRGAQDRKHYRVSGGKGSSGEFNNEIELDFKQDGGKERCYMKCCATAANLKEELSWSQCNYTSIHSLRSRNLEYQNKGKGLSREENDTLSMSHTILNSIGIKS